MSAMINFNIHNNLPVVRKLVYINEENEEIFVDTNSGLASIDQHLGDGYQGWTVKHINTDKIKLSIGIWNYVTNTIEDHTKESLEYALVKGVEIDCIPNSELYKYIND